MLIIVIIILAASPRDNGASAATAAADGSLAPALSQVRPPRPISVDARAPSPAH